MRRRDFIKGITVLTTWPVAARAQQTSKTHRIALVHPSASIADMNESGGNQNYVALFGELRRLGYIEGVNLVVARYSGEGREEHFVELCQEIARTKPDVIVASSSRLALSCKAATATVPIVATMADPIPSGIVVNIARPEVVPTASKVGFLGSHQIWSQPPLNELRKAAQQLGISLLGPPMETPFEVEEYRRVLAKMAQERVDGVIIGDQPEHSSYKQFIVDLVRAAKLPAVFPYSEDSLIGALIAYGSSSPALYRRLATYIDQILKGAHPADLPIYLTSKFDLTINLRTAKALGLNIPPSLLVRADEVIE